MRRRILPRLSAVALLATALILDLLPGAAPAAEAAAPVTQVRVTTTLGDFVIALDAERAPLSVANFLEYVRAGFYSDLIFHRVVSGFVVQGGGYRPDGTEKPLRPEIPNESGNGLANRRGTVSLARYGPPHSAASQFFVNLADNPGLDPQPDGWGYAVFGTVVEGMEVVDRIGAVPTGRFGPFAEQAPLEAIAIRRMEILVPPPAPPPSP